MRLVLAFQRIRGRLREASGLELPIAEVAVIKRLRHGGPATASALAAAEHVTHQAITQTLASLKAKRLVRAAPDPSDGRKNVLTVTAAGLRLYDSAVASRDAWLARAIDGTLSPRERAVLAKGIALLERIAES